MDILSNLLTGAFIGYIVWIGLTVKRTQLDVDHLYEAIGNLVDMIGAPRCSKHQKKVKTPATPPVYLWDVDKDKDE